MTAIGFRCFNDKFSFVVLAGDQNDPKLVCHDTCALPSGVCWAGKLAWVRQRVQELVRAHAVTRGALKRAEPLARKAYPLRSEIEGVVKEAIYDATRVDCLARIKSQLKRDISGFSEPVKYVARALSDKGLADIKAPAYQEAALAALCELPEADDA